MVEFSIVILVFSKGVNIDGFEKSSLTNKGKTPV